MSSQRGDYWPGLLTSIDFPEQGRLIDTMDNPISREVYEKAMKLCRTVAAKEGVDKALQEHNLDMIALPMDSPSPRIAAAAGRSSHNRWTQIADHQSGYPIATVPLGKLDYNGRPFGLAIIAKAGREDLLFAFMSAFEAVSEPRPLPLRLLG